MALQTFPMLLSLDRDKLRKGFLENILEKQGWKNEPDLTIDSVMKQISDLEQQTAAIVTQIKGMGL